MSAGNGSTQPGWAGREAPSLDDFEAIARVAYAGLPEAFRGLVGDIQIRIADFPEEDVLKSLGIESEFDLLAGALNGVVFRVTLAPDGTPLVYDTIHPCGCYHLFFTTPRAVPLPSPPGEVEWAFVPQKLRAMNVSDRLVVRIASGTHYVERVYRDQDDSLARYDLRHYDDLRSLPRMTGGSRSVFRPDGIIAGTERNERFLLWPMGIENAGAMRQWGRHATAFVGRRHFDDANLLERRFELDLR